MSRRLARVFRGLGQTANTAYGIREKMRMEQEQNDVRAREDLYRRLGLAVQLAGQGVDPGPDTPFVDEGLIEEGVLGRLTGKANTPPDYESVPGMPGYFRKPGTLDVERPEGLPEELDEPRVGPGGSILVRDPNAPSGFKWVRPEGAEDGSSGVEGTFSYLLGIEDPEQRRLAFDGLSQGTRDQLIESHGEDLALPDPTPKGDAVLKRRALDAEPAMQTLDALGGYLDDKKYTYAMGPTLGRVLGANPYDADVQEFQSRMYMAAQVVGKFLEGGVLRAEDTEKYKKMLPQMTDTPDVAKAKLKNAMELVRAVQDAYMDGASRETPVEGMPFNPLSIDVETLGQWLKDNRDHEKADAVFRIWKSRTNGTDR